MGDLKKIVTLLFIDKISKNKHSFRSIWSFQEELVVYKTLKKMYFIPRTCLTAFLVMPEHFLTNQSWVEFVFRVMLLTCLSVGVEYKLVHPYLMQSRSLTQHKIRTILALVISRPLLLLGTTLLVLNYFLEPGTSSILGSAIVYTGIVLNNSFYFGSVRTLVHRIQEDLRFE